MLEYKIKGKCLGVLYNSYKGANGQPVTKATITLQNERGQSSKDIAIDYNIEVMVAERIGLNRDNAAMQYKAKEVELSAYPLYQYGKLDLVVTEVRIVGEQK